ncbi:MAG: hypothetical protein GKR94_11395 [Gammaproteobacteria bacterium]|nr:hypothetical protein [Gammaproteobacteria bacterium]
MNEYTARKPLYLMSINRVTVRYGSGSLAVFSGRNCRGRYPLERISRILSTANVDWRGDALFACTRARISIVLIDRRGGWHGTIEPPLVQLSPVVELLDELVTDSDYPDVFDNFMRHLRSKTLKRWLSKRGACADGEFERKEWVRSYVYGGQPPHDLQYDFRGLLRALVESRLHKLGVRSRYSTEAGDVLDLAGHLCELVYGEIVMNSGTIPVTTSDTRASIRFFQASVEDYSQSIDHALKALQRLLANRVRRWH